MNVRLSWGKLWNTGQGMRTAAWCMVFMGMLAAGRSAVAEDTAATRTTLTVATSNVGPRTRATLTVHVTAPDQSGSPSGVVNFRSGDLDLGSAFLDGEGNASLETDNLTAGTHQVVAVYKGKDNNQISVSKPEQVQAYVSTVAGFTVAAAPTSLSTAVGGFVTSIVTVTPVNGFSGYVSLSCNGLPVNTTCTFTPVSVPANCTTSGSCVAGASVMQIQTQSPSPGTAENHQDAGMRRYVFVFPALFGLLGLGACKRRAWRNLALAMLTCAGIMGITACAQRYRYLNHGPPDNPGTPVGSYTITVVAESSTGSQTTTPPTEPQITLKITAPKS
jgi:Bacterial Ig-like domain (group 3)